MSVFQVKYPKQFFEKEILDRNKGNEADLPKRILSLDISGAFYPSISNLLYDSPLIWIKKSEKELKYPNSISKHHTFG